MKRASSTDLGAELFAAPEARLALLRAAWPHAVGGRLAGRTEVLAVEGHNLRIRVPDRSWQRELHRMRRDILGRLREIAGRLAPRALGFTVGPVAVPAGEPENAEPELPSRLEAPPALEAEAEGISDPELRRVFLETAARYLHCQQQRRREEQSQE